MTLDEAIREAKEHAKAHKLTGYVHTDATIGHNFRFLRPIEDVTPDDVKAQTVAVVFASGKVTRVDLFDDYVKALWPADVPQDCTNIKTVRDDDPKSMDEEDCLTRNLHDSHQCDSCRAYSKLAEQFERRRKD